MNLPFQPPLAPMLAKLQRAVPKGEEWLYEPKWDGFRAIVFYDGSEVYIGSRDERPLNRYFPELITLFTDALPSACVIDGEIVVRQERGLDFNSLQLRIHPAESRVRMLAEEIPASFIAFDLLADGEQDLRNDSFESRRKVLEELLVDADGHRITVTPQTPSADEAEEWLDRYEEAGFEGVVAKKRDQTYQPGKRPMIKIKVQRTADCVVGGYRLSKTGDGVGSLLLGLYDNAGNLQYVGHTSSFKAKERRELLEQLRELEGESGFGHGRSPGGPSRWAAAREQSWVPLLPELVCEVSFDRYEGDRFRHAATFMRWRTDKRPQECTLDQVAPLSD
jgi:ATP-dependent DNA ligase